MTFLTPLKKMTPVSLSIDTNKTVICSGGPLSSSLFTLCLEFEGKKFKGGIWNYCPLRLEGTISSHCFQEQLLCLCGSDNDLYRRWKRQVKNCDLKCLLAPLLCAYDCSLWHFFCLGVCLTMILYQMIEDCLLPDLPFPVWLPVTFSSGIFTGNMLSYLYLVASGLEKMTCPPLSMMATLISQFSNSFQPFFGEGSPLSSSCLFKQTIDITTAACKKVLSCQEDLEDHKRFINDHLSSLEIKLNYRIDSLFGKMQREINNTTIDLHHKISSRLPVISQTTEEVVFPVDSRFLEEGFTFPLSSNNESSFILSSLK